MALWKDVPTSRTGSCAHWPDGPHLVPLVLPDQDLSRPSTRSGLLHHEVVLDVTQCQVLQVGSAVVELLNGAQLGVGLYQKERVLPLASMAVVVVHCL